MYSVGIDIEKTSRFAGKKKESPFLKRIFTFEELCYCFKRGHASEHLAGRFAAKESVKKALAGITKQLVDYKDIEVINDKSGVPLVSLKKDLGKGFNFSLSISHTKDIAMAIILATKK